MSATDTSQPPRPSSWTRGGGGGGGGGSPKPKRHSSLRIVRRLSRSKSVTSPPSATATTAATTTTTTITTTITAAAAAAITSSSATSHPPTLTLTGAKNTQQTKSKYAALLTSFFADVTPILSSNPISPQPRRALTLRPEFPTKRASAPDMRGGMLTMSGTPIHGSGRLKKIFRRSWTSVGSVSSTSSSIASTVTVVPEMEYRDIEKALARFQSKERYRVEILRTQLIPWLQRNEDDVSISDILDPEREKEAAATRMMMIKWWTALLNTAGQASYAERILYFDCILAIMVRSEFDEYDRHPVSLPEPDFANTRLTRGTSLSRCSVRRRPSHKRDNAGSDDAATEYRAALAATMTYAVERLNQRGVYANVVGFCAKVFALCFFKIPGVAIALLYALPVGRGLHKRMHRELGSLLGDRDNQERLAMAFPTHLHKLICLDPAVWNKRFERDRRDFEPPIEMTGNWVRRWQSDDSELFFTFYKHYHTLLHSHLTPTFPDLSTHPSRTQILASSPGYLHLSSFFLGKIDALLHRQIFAVTTVVQFDPSSTSDPNLSPQYPSSRGMPPATEFPDRYPRHQTPAATSNANSAAQAQAAAGFLQNGKPRVLEMASRRFAECAVTCAAAGEGAFGEVLGGWVKAAIEKTSLYEVESVFCLLDFIESIIFEHELRANPPPSSHLPRPAPSSQPSNFANLPVPFLLDALALLLTTADHTVTLLRALSFVHAHFALLTSTPQNMDRLCRGILLSEDVFARLMLHWAKNVRVYFIRVLVWRVARMGDRMREDRKEMGENEVIEVKVSEGETEGRESKKAEADGIVEEDAIVSAIFTQLQHRLYLIRVHYFHLHGLAQKAHLDHEPPARIEGVDFVPARQEVWGDQGGNTTVDAVWPRSEEDHVGEEGMMVQRFEDESNMSLDLAVDDVDAEADTEDLDADIDEDVDEDEDEIDELDLDVHLSGKFEKSNEELVAVDQGDANAGNTRAEVDEQGGIANTTSGARDLPQRTRRRLSLYKRNVGTGEAERGRGRQGRSSQRRSNKMDNQRVGRSGSGQGILRFLFPGLVGVNNDYVSMDGELGQPASLTTASGSYTSSTSASSTSASSTSASSTSSLSTVTTTESSIPDTAPVPIDKDDDLPLRVLSKVYPAPSVALLMQPAAPPSALGEHSAYTPAYPPTKHAYAARALLELEAVAHEQAVWEFELKDWERKAGEAGGRGGHVPQFPGMFVEWPKYWNWEKPIL